MPTKWEGGFWGRLDLGLSRSPTGPSPFFKKKYQFTGTVTKIPITPYGGLAVQCHPQFISVYRNY